jgi:hypothetical protein
MIYGGSMSLNQRMHGVSIFFIVVTEKIDVSDTQHDAKL